MTLCKLYYYGQNSIKYIYPNKILSKSNFVPEKRNVRLEGWLLAGILFLFDPNDVTASCEGKFVLYFLVAKSTLELACHGVTLFNIIIMTLYWPSLDVSVYVNVLNVKALKA